MLTLLLLVLGLQSPAQAPPAQAVDTAALQVSGKTVFVFRAPFGPEDAAGRAAAASRRIAAMMEIGGDSVSVRLAPGGAMVSLGTRPVFMVTPADIDTVFGGTLIDQAARAADQLRVAVQQRREAVSLKRILIGTLLALLATAVLVLLARFLYRGHQNLRERAKSVRLPTLSLRGLVLLRPEQLRSALRGVITALGAAIALFLLYLYITFVLSRFPWTRAWGEALGQFLFTTLKRLGLGALRSIPDLFTVAIIFVITRYISNFLRTLFGAAKRGAITLPGIHRDVAEPTRRIATALVWLFALVVAYPYLPGSESAAFKGVSVFAGLLVTLGSAGIVGQAMSGLVVMYSRSFRVGDFIKVGEIQGTVLQLGMLSTRLRTPKNEVITLPNSVVVSGAITDYTAIEDYNAPLLLYSSVTIGYDVPWRQVHELMIQAARGVDGVEEKPEPFVLQRALNDWYVEYQINLAIPPANAPRMPGLYAQLHANLQDAFFEAGVEIMSPSFFALRDGNTVQIPEKQRPPGQAAFRVDLGRSGQS